MHLPPFAGMAELVDAPDSKSGFPRKWGFDSLYPHHRSLLKIVSEHIKAERLKTTDIAMTFLRAAVVALVMGYSAQASAAQCVVVTLKDENGTIIKTDAPIIGLVVDGMRPLVNQGLPLNSISEPGAPAQCPADLLAAAQQLFDQSCLSDQARDALVKSTGQMMAEVSARCRNIFKALK